MTHYPPLVTWQRRDNCLALRTGQRLTLVPAQLAAHLLKAFPDGLDDPTDDLLRAEETLRRRAENLRQRSEQLTLLLARKTSRVGELSRVLGVCDGGARHRALDERRRLAGDLRELVGEAQQVSDEMHHTDWLIRALRTVVLALDCDDGLLGEAARGWRRSSLRPAWVTETYASEDAFLDGDARRAVTAGWGGRVTAAEHLTSGWRRDDDEPDPDADPLELAGPWEVGYVSRTGELYALRRCHYRAEELWVLGWGFADGDAARDLLARAQARQREPNSLLWLADLVHDASFRTSANSSFQDIA